MNAIDITVLQADIYCAGAICCVVAFVAILLRVLPIGRHRRRCEESAQSNDENKWVDASIIVYSNDEVTDLEVLLPQLLAQEYPGRFEVVVVNEGESPRVQELVGMLQLKHSNLYLTHTPDGARNLSRKKLAITLGVKAARYPAVVLTAASGRVESPLWLSRMTQHFGNGSPVEVVIGYAAPEPYTDSHIGARCRSFDYVASSAAWVGDAIAQKPWRGTEYNVAYLRDLFFRNKGFSRHLNLRFGDDDIFINEIANRDNTAVELSADSIVAIDGGNSANMLREDFSRRRFTRRFISNRPWLLGILTQWIYLLGFIAPIAAAAICPLSVWSWIFAGAGLLLWYLAALPWRIAVKALNGRRLMLTLPWLALTRPLRLASRTLYAITHRSKHYSWQ